MMKMACGIALGAALVAMIAAPVAAQEKYPSRPILMVMPTPPGGGTDVLGRKLAELVEPILGQKVVVENKPGAAGTIGINQVVEARPDGYVIGAMWNGAVTTTPHTLQLPYSLDSFVPFLQIGASSYVMCVQPDFPAKTGAEMVAHLKANPGKFTYGNDGVGNTMQLAAERIFGALGVKVRGVPFNGAGETARNFLGGHVDLYGGSLVAIQPHMAAGKAKCLMLTSADDNPAMPDASGLRKLGVPELETVLWWGLIAPKGIAADRLAALEAAFLKAAQSDAYRDTLTKVGAAPVFRGSVEFQSAIKTEYAALGEVVKQLGLEKKAR